MAESESVKTFQHVDGEVVYSFEYDKGKESLCIRISNKLLCEEYLDIFDNSSNIFNGHSIIRKPSILFNIFVDHYEKDDKRVKLTFAKSCERSKNADDCKKYVIDIQLSLDYISDDMSLEIQQSRKRITPQQFIERIDYRFNEYIPTLESRIVEMNNTIGRLETDRIIQIEKRAEECSKNTTNEIDTLKTKFTELQKYCDKLLELATGMSKQQKILTDRILPIEQQFKNTSNEIDTLKAKLAELRKMCEQKFTQDQYDQ